MERKIRGIERKMLRFRVVGRNYRRVNEFRVCYLRRIRWKKMKDGGNRPKKFILDKI